LFSCHQAYRHSGICKLCVETPATSAHAILSREHLAQEKLATLHKICASCSGTPLNDKILCDSIDCPITYARTQAGRDMDDMVDVRRALDVLDLESPEKKQEGPWGSALDW
jgi:DNA polymerase zeta